MDRMSKTERLIAITKLLLERPGFQFGLNQFSEEFECAKSTLSEDLSTIQRVLKRIGKGVLESTIGAGGGVRYTPSVSKEEINSFSNQLCNTISDKKRIIPGGYLYLSDIIFSPQISNKVGEIFSSIYSDLQGDYVVTVETKGIPFALKTAHYLNLPLVVVRREAKVTEGPAVSITYVSGSSGRIQTMSLPKRAIEKGSKVIFIDDFMKAGGTAKGISELMAEFGAEVVGNGVFISTNEPELKLIKEYTTLLKLNKVDGANKYIEIIPGL